MKNKIVVLTGAGISAESGIKTFRDSGGLWEEHDIYEVASPMGWAKDMELVLNFYNQRRSQLKDVQPNEAHKALARLEEKFEVKIITQNVDNLHERGGSTDILHLHGELTKARSTADPNVVYEIGYNNINKGDVCEKGAQLRPHIVWFGEPVPLISEAAEICSDADIFIVIGSSLAVYPAAGLIEHVPDEAVKYIIDPSIPSIPGYYKNLTYIQEKASTGTVKLIGQLLN